MFSKKTYNYLFSIIFLFFINSNAYSNSVLVVNVHCDRFDYDNDGKNINQTLLNINVNSSFFNLKQENENDLVELINSSEDISQIWVFDLSTNEDNYINAWKAISDWFKTEGSKSLICDARMISSYWNEKWKTEGQNLSENYYTYLNKSNKGLLLATDHSEESSNYQKGINSINEQIGINPFSGIFSLEKIPVDENNELMSVPNKMGDSLSDDSSPGQVPFGLQPNGMILYSIAWHSGNQNTPGISATIQGEVGFHVNIDYPKNNSIFYKCQPIVFISSYTSTTNDNSATFSWSSNLDGVLGAGNNIEISSLSIGDHIISLQGVGNLGGADSKELLLKIKELPNEKMYTKDEVDLIIKNLLEFDCDSNGKLSLVEAIKALKVAAGVK